MASIDQDMTKVLAYFSQQRNLERKLAEAIREAMDMVLDGRHTGRCSIEELDKVEKTYIGTKVEHLIIHKLELKKFQRFDTRISGVPVDIKCTIGNNWSIPKEAVGQICLLVRVHEMASKFWVGLLRVAPELLNPGTNHDGKRTLNKVGRAQVHWLVCGGDLPRNFLLTLPKETREAILAGKSGTERMAELFRRCIGKVIDGVTIETVGQQRDSSKRVRGDGGARSVLEPEGILVCSIYDNTLLVASGFPRLKKGEFMSLRRSMVSSDRRSSRPAI